MSWPTLRTIILGPDEEAFDLGVVDVLVIRAPGDAQVVTRAHEEFLGGVLQAALGDAEAQCTFILENAVEQALLPLMPCVFGFSAWIRTPAG
jgi:hypothetical protein